MTPTPLADRTPTFDDDGVLQAPWEQANRPPEHLSASDEDHRNPNLERARSSGPKAPFDVLTSKGWRPFYPQQLEPAVSSERIEADNPLNPKGGPSQSLPQQATPLTSEQGVLSLDDMADNQRALDIAATQDGLAPDDPRNPRGTPDYIVEGVTDPNAPLTLASLNPTTTPLSNDPVTLTLQGAGFPPDAAVTIDGAPATSTTVASPNRLTTTFVPDTAGTKQVAVNGSAPLPFEVTPEGIDARSNSKTGITRPHGR
jgi:hypothetical protein